MTHYDVVVVGAGMAGLAAARALSEKRRSVVVLEASDRIGGRAWTDSTTFGFPLDRGAQWIEGDKTNPLLALARELRFSTRVDPERVIARIGRRASTGEVNRLYEEAGRRIEKARREVEDKGALDRSVASVLRPPRTKQERLAQAWIGPLDAGVELDRLSAFDNGRQPGEQAWLMRKGMGALVKAFGCRVAVERGVRVWRIDSRSKRMSVETDQGSFTADAVIVTVSTGVLNAGDIRFVPKLPAHVLEAIAGLPMGHLVKVAVALSRPISKGWPFPTFSAITRSGTPVYGLLNPWGQNLAILMVGGDAALDLQREGKDATIEFAKSALVGVHGASIRTILGRADTTPWSCDQFTRGAYSAALPGRGLGRETLTQPVDERLIFAGEATDPKWAARVAGAYTSGLRAARQALRFLERR